ncbi:MAG: hypothetical protein SVV67_10835 [Bacillota bacterium]|nr:hypothetical protein [Bacillota bacterium]
MKTFVTAVAIAILLLSFAEPVFAQEGYMNQNISYHAEGSDSSEDYRLYYEQYLPSTGEQ